MHLVVKPLALILLLIAPDIHALALDFIHLELALIYGAIGEGKLTFAVLLSFIVFSLVDSTIGPSLKTKSVLLIVTP